MKKLILMGIVAAIILILPVTAYANLDRDTVEAALDGAIDAAIEMGVEVIDWDVDTIDRDFYMPYTIFLERGDYSIVVFGGVNITSINLLIYYEDEYEREIYDPFVEGTQDYDTIATAYSDFTLRTDETIVIEIVPEEFARREDRGYYAIIFVDSTEQTDLADDRDLADEKMDISLDYWGDFDDIEIGYSDVDFVVEDTTMTYIFTLEPGDYGAVAATGVNITEISLACYYEDEYEDGDLPFMTGSYVDNDTTSSGIEFTLRRTETIVFEIYPVDFIRGEDTGYYMFLTWEETGK